jgi:hypothetical protein
MLLYLIVILWGVEQVALQRIAKATHSDRAWQSGGIAFIVGCVGMIIAASPQGIGAIVAGVLAMHGLVTAPLLFAGRERRARRSGHTVSSPAARKRMPFL